MTQIQLAADIRTLHRRTDYAAALQQFDSVKTLSAELQLLKGLSLFMSGENAAGMELIGAAIDETPSNDDWASDRALALLLKGQPEAARAVLDGLIERNVASPVDYGRRAAAGLTLGDADAAMLFYSEAIAREPGRVEWHYNLSNVYGREQRYEEALEQCELALGIQPDHQPAEAARLNLLISLERTDEIVEGFEQKLADDPDNEETRLLLARAMVQDGRFTDAFAVLRAGQTPIDELMELKSSDAEAYDACQQKELALRALHVQIFVGRSMYVRALAMYNDIEKLEPEVPLPYQLGKISVLSELQQFDEAEELLEQVLKDHPDENATRISQSQLYNEMGRYEEAEDLLRDLVETYPGNANLLTNLGQTLLWVGKVEEAATMFQRAAEVNPMALTQLVKARRYPDDPAVIAQMESLADNKFLPREARANMCFALHETLDKHKDYPRAFDYLALANELVDRDLGYKAENFSHRVDLAETVFTQEFFAGLPAVRGTDRTPVFVVGMPRSGTTLTEQILCSHPSVFGAGELDLMPTLLRLLPKVLKTRQAYPRCMYSLTAQLREEAARYYLYGLKQHDEEAPFVVDKLPHNFMNLGLIASILPGAKIIHIQRDPRDNALSNLQQNFKAKEGGMGYAFNLQNTADQINDYVRMMQHWREVLPVPMFELTYEELVSDQEGMTRELLEFIGVEWDDQVRDFHKTERAVRTASVSQVREPIYTSSKQKWRRYEAELAPLIERLSNSALAPWELESA